MSAPTSLITPLSQSDQQVMSLAHLYAMSAESLTDQSFGQVAYSVNGRGSVPIPTGFLLEGLVAHFHLDVTLNLNALAAPALSALDVYAAVNEIFLRYNGSESTIWSTDSIFAAQRLAMEFPFSDYELTFVKPTPSGTGTAYSYDWYADVPAVYSLADLRGVLNENSNSVHSAAGIQWGDVAHMFVLGSGQTATATGYCEFLAKRQSAPSDPAIEGSPDLTKNYIVTYQDFALTGSKNNRLVLDASDTITRITLNFYEGGVGNGGVEAYDTTNALQVSNVKLGWASNMAKFDSPYWYWQQEIAKWYGTAMTRWINKGTVIIDLDKTGGRDWIDAESVTSLAATIDLNAAPPAGSFCRATLEQLVNSGTVPLR